MKFLILNSSNPLLSKAYTLISAPRKDYNTSVITLVYRANPAPAKMRNANAKVYMSVVFQFLLK
jgi:hypothetical protein